jgi:predicted flap endonuclease-1-like 5' DNA nuclease
VSYKIDKIEGIGPAMSEKLGQAGIATTDDLLDKCASKKGRVDTAAATGISETYLLKWANKADLMRVSGIGEEYSDLLEVSGVDTVKELRNRNAENLAAKMKEVNDVKKLTRALPSADVVGRWIEQAKTMEPIISH